MFLWTPHGLNFLTDADRILSVTAEGNLPTYLSVNAGQVSAHCFGKTFKLFTIHEYPNLDEKSLTLHYWVDDPQKRIAVQIVHYPPHIDGSYSQILEYAVSFDSTDCTLDVIHGNEKESTRISQIYKEAPFFLIRDRETVSLHYSYGGHTSPAIEYSSRHTSSEVHQPYAAEKLGDDVYVYDITGAHLLSGDNNDEAWVLSSRKHPYLVKKTPHGLNVLRYGADQDIYIIPYDAADKEDLDAAEVQIYEGKELLFVVIFEGDSNHIVRVDRLTGDSVSDQVSLHKKCKFTIVGDTLVYENDELPRLFHVSWTDRDQGSYPSYWIALHQLVAYRDGGLETIRACSHTEKVIYVLCYK